MLNSDFNRENKIKQLGYSLPENYFVDLEQEINSQLPNSYVYQSNNAKVTTLFSLIKNKLLWSAAAVALLLIGFFWFTGVSDTVPTLSNDLADLDYLFEEDLDTEKEVEFTLLDMYLAEDNFFASDVNLQKMWFENNFED